MAIVKVKIKVDIKGNTVWFIPSIPIEIINAKRVDLYNNVPKGLCPKFNNGERTFKQTLIEIREDLKSIEIIQK